MGLPPADFDPRTENVVGVIPVVDQNGKVAEQSYDLGDDGDENDDMQRDTTRDLANDTIFADIAYHFVFQNFTVGVIVVNALWIAIDTQWNHESLRDPPDTGKLPLSPVSDIIENLFCLYFTVEVVIRFLAFKKKVWCFLDGWFVFDSFLVTFMIIETWIMKIVELASGDSGGGPLASFSAFRLLRLLRLTRMARLMRTMPELMMLVRGMIAATRAVSVILMFQVGIMYVFAIVFTSQLGEWYAPEHKDDWEPQDDPMAVELFGSIGDSMMTLFTQGVLGDNLLQCLQSILDRAKACPEEKEWRKVNGKAIEPTVQDCPRNGGSVLLFWVFIVFFILTALTMLNMLIGVLCEVVQSTAANEEASQQQAALKMEMLKAFKWIDESGDGMITITEWEKMKDQTTFRVSMRNLGVEDEHMEQRLTQLEESLFGYYERDPHEDLETAGSEHPPVPIALSFNQFMNKVTDIRPDSPASSLDIEVLRVSVEREQNMFDRQMCNIEGMLERLMEEEEQSTAIVKTESHVSKMESPITQDALAPITQDGLGPILKDVPTEVLFSELKKRAPPQVGLPKVLADRDDGREDTSNCC